MDNFPYGIVELARNIGICLRKPDFPLRKILSLQKDFKIIFRIV